MNKFYICDFCKNIVHMVQDSGVNPVCCGQPMRELVPNTTEAATEKHLPVVTVNGNEVKVVVGSVEHPMTPEHLISWIVLETTEGVKITKLTHTAKPEATFVLNADEKAIAAYEYCNLHGFWKTEIK